MPDTASLDALDTLLAQQGDASAADRLHQRSLSQRESAFTGAQIVRRSTAGQRAASGQDVAPAIKMREAEALAPAVTPPVPVGEDQGFVGGGVSALAGQGLRLMRGAPQLAADVTGNQLTGEYADALRMAEQQTAADAAAGGPAAKAGGMVAGALPFLAAAATGPAGGALLVGGQEAVGSYGEARDTLHMDPWAAAGRALVQGTAAGGSMAVAPVSAAAALPTAKTAAMSLPAALARGGAVAAADAVPQAAVYDLGGAGVDIAQGTLRDDPLQRQTGVDRASELPQHLPEMALAGGVLGAAHAPGARRAAQAQVADQTARAAALADQQLAQQASGRLRMPAEPADQQAASIADTLERGDLAQAEYPELPPDAVAAERARVASLAGQRQADARRLADVDAQRASEARNADALNLLLPDVQALSREREGVAAAGADLARQRRAADIAKGVDADVTRREQIDLAGADAEQQRAEEGALATEASAQAEESRREAEAKAQVERGSALDAERVAIADDEGRLSDLQQALEARGTVAEQVKAARERIENEYLQASSRTSADDIVDLSGVTRPLDRSVLRANKGEISQRVQQEAENIRAAHAKARQEIAATRAKIAERKVAVREGYLKLAEERRAAREAAAAERRAVPKEPVAAKRGDEPPAAPIPSTIPAPRDRRAALRAIYEARTSGKLTAEQAKAAVERLNRNTQDSHAPSPAQARPAAPLAEQGAPPAAQVQRPAGSDGTGDGGAARDVRLPSVRAPGAGSGVSAAAGATPAERGGSGVVGDGSAGGAGSELIRQRTAEVGEAEAKAETSKALQAAEEVQRVADRRLDLAKARLADLQRAEEESARAPGARADLAEAKESLAVAKQRRAVEEAQAEADSAAEQVSHARRMADLVAQRRAVEQDTAEIKAAGAELDRERANLDAEYADMRKDAEGGVEKAALAEATAQQKAAAADLAGKAAIVAEKRTAAAKARLEDLESSSVRDTRAINAAKEDLARATLDAAKSKLLKAKADNLVRDTKRSAAEERVTAHQAAQREHTQRLMPDIERGARATFGKDVSARMTIDGDVEILDPEGKRIQLYRMNLEKRPIKHTDLENWWASAGGENIRAWLRGQAGTASERLAGKAAFRMLGGEMPRSPEHIRDILPPSKIVDFIKRASGMDAVYNPVNGDATFFNVSEMKSQHAFDNALHEGNHRVVHGMLRLALAGKGALEHVDVLAKATGIDPRAEGQTVPFLEAVQRRYAAFAKTAAARASSAARRAKPNAFDRAMAYIAKQLKRTFSFLGFIRKRDPSAQLSIDDVFAEIESGKWRDTIPPRTTGGDTGEAFAARVPARDVSKLREDVANAETPEDAERAAGRLAKADRSLGDIPKEHRGIAEQARTATQAQRETYAQQERAADALIAEKGYAKALADARKRGEERAQRLSDDERDTATVDDIIIQREMTRLLDTHTESGRFDYNRFNDLMLAHSISGEEAGRRLAFFRDRIETPSERRGAARKALLTPSPRTMKALKKLHKQMKAAEARGDDVGARKAGELFDAMQERLVSSQRRRIAAIKEATGIDISDNATLDALLGDKEAFATNMAHIEDMANAADPQVNVLDWIVANQRAGMLSDIPTTQTQQFVGNLASMLSGTVRDTIRRPGAVLAALRGDLGSAILKNMADSVRSGKNAFVDRYLNLEIGRGEVDSSRNPADTPSRWLRRISFDIMAGIDGAAQRYNAQLELAGLLYTRARANGKSTSDASSEATAVLRDGPADEDVAEAIWRSLPATFQELAIPRPGTKGTGLDKIISAVTHGQSAIDDYLGRKLGEHVGWLRDKESGEHLPFPITRILLPFVRTPLAMANAAIRHSPAGLTHMTAAWKNVRTERDAGGDVTWAKEQVWRRSYEAILVGGLAMHGLAYALNATGTNGEMDTDKTLEILGKRVGYSRVEPFATPLAMAANGIKAWKQGKSIAEIPLYELTALFKLGSDLAWFRLLSDVGVGVGNVTKEMRRPDGDAVQKGKEELQTAAAKVGLGLVPFAGARAIRGPLASGDEITKAEKGPVGYIKGEYGIDRIPVRDAWGAPVKRGPIASDGLMEGAAERAIQGGLGRSRLPSSTDVDDWLEAKGVDVPDWRPKAKGGKALPEHEADAFIAKAGPKLLDAVKRIKATNPNITPEQLKKAIDNLKTRIGKAVRADLADDV